jgi:hypothetical protein
MGAADRRPYSAARSGDESAFVSDGTVSAKKSMAERLAGGEGELQLLMHEVSYALRQLKAHSDRQDQNALATATHAALDSYFRVRRLATVVGLSPEQQVQLQRQLRELGVRLGVIGHA